MTEKNTLNVRNFNNWIVDVAEEAGAWVEQTDLVFEFFVNDRVRLSNTSLVELIKEIDESGLLGRGLLEDLTAVFNF